MYLQIKVNEFPMTNCFCCHCIDNAFMCLEPTRKIVRPYCIGSSTMDAEAYIVLFELLTTSFIVLRVSVRTRRVWYDLLFDLSILEDNTIRYRTHWHCTCKFATNLMEETHITSSDCW
jgi:hypothetical protein